MKPRLAELCIASVVLATSPAIAITRYVDLNNPSPTPPYTSWATAATNIQDAIDAAVTGDTVLVTNGHYHNGGRLVGASLLTNRVAVTKPVTVLSVNGPNATMISGYQVPGSTNGDSAIRCVYLTNGATLSGFTLVGGATRTLGGDADNSGGGVWCASTAAVLSNCIVLANYSGNGGGGVYNGTLYDCTVASNSVIAGRGWGGGVWGSTLTRCLLRGNSAQGSGGGAYQASLLNCILFDNLAFTGGGTFDCTLNNCTVVGNRASNSGGGIVGGSAICHTTNSLIYFNEAPTGSNWAGGGGYNAVHNCTTPMPPYSGSFGNITNLPRFLSTNDWSDLRAQSNSPCINAGKGDAETGLIDFAGNQRIAGATVDIGAHEFQSPSSLLSYAWAQQYGLPTDGSADFTDSDGDGHNNWQEWRADTIPTNAVSILRLLAPTKVAGGINLTWQSASTRSYWLERLSHFGGALPFQPIATNIAGVNGVKSFTDVTATNTGPYFYRVGVQP